MADGDGWDGVIDTPADDAPADGIPFGALVFAQESAESVDASLGEGEDYPFANAFTQELENVAASDWDVDADALWGGGEPEMYDLGAEPSSAAFDFPA